MSTFPFIDLNPNVSSAARTNQLDVESIQEAVEATDSAEMDIEVAREYIRNSGLSPKSIENSQKELYRFLAWCRKESKKTLSQLNLGDLNAYKEFLQNPPPHWISKTKWPRNDPRYRPLTNALSDASLGQAIIAVKALLAFAEQTGYLKNNPAALLRHVRLPAWSGVTRYLTPGAVALAIETVSRRPSRPAQFLRRRERDRFLLLAYVHTGARLNEIVGATMGAIYFERHAHWWFDLAGRGKKPRRVPVPDDVIDAFRRYREAFGLSSYPERGDPMPLVLSSRKRVTTSVTDEAASEAIKGIFSEAADVAAQAGNVDTADLLRQASAHWLRHSMLVKHVNNGVQLKTLQETAGHVSLQTTASYLLKTDNERHAEIIASTMNKEQR